MGCGGSGGGSAVAAGGSLAAAVDTGAAHGSGGAEAAVSEAAAMEVVQNLDAEMLYAMAKSLGWEGAEGNRKRLVKFCVARRIGGPRRQDRDGG